MQASYKIGGIIRPLFNRIAKVSTFGTPMRQDEELLRAEDLVKKWHTLFYPRLICGGRSYALVGNKISEIFPKY